MTPARRDPRRAAYRSASQLARDRMAAESPADADALASVEAADIVVVPGSYDHVELVLDALDLPHTRVAAERLPRVQLRPEQLLVVNCPGHLPADALRQVERFVHAGGSLFSTDWALRNLIEPAFPGVLAYNDRPTADAVVRIEVTDHDNPFLRGVLDGADEPVWWLEGSSYPIRILAPEVVQVLITSRELAERWGERPVAVLFRHGAGEVFHMVSHYYLQRTELRSSRQAAPASAYWQEKGMRMPAAVAGDVAGLTVGDIESAATSARLFANVVADKKRRGARPRDEVRR